MVSEPPFLWPPIKQYSRSFFGVPSGSRLTSADRTANVVFPLFLRRSFRRPPISVQSRTANSSGSFYPSLSHRHQDSSWPKEPPKEWCVNFTLPRPYWRVRCMRPCNQHTLARALHAPGAPHHSPTSTCPPESRHVSPSLCHVSS
jgi:hypothetical protein